MFNECSTQPEPMPLLSSPPVYGERTVSFQDSFGHVWHFHTVKETLTVEEMMKRVPKQE
jgi:hypothetical protein